MKLKNLNGTEDNTCCCPSWLEHWKKFSEQQIPEYCSEVKCMYKPTVGAHVQKNNDTDRNWYIVPLCNGHNRNAEYLEISNSVTLVPANVSETCAKSKTK